MTIDNMTRPGLDEITLWDSPELEELATDCGQVKQRPVIIFMVPVIKCGLSRYNRADGKEY